MVFKKGQSGNPAGRKRGSRNTATVALEDLLKGHGEALVQKAVDLALAGHPAMLKLCLERLYPPRRGRGVEIPFGEITSASDLAGAQLAVLTGMGRGTLSPEEAEAAARALDTAGTALERVDLERRIAVLEEQAAAIKNLGLQK